jgi:hypothetical protein
MKWTEILSVLESNIAFYQDPKVTEDVVRKQLDIANAVKSIVPEVDSVIATGFPPVPVTYGRICGHW